MLVRERIGYCLFMCWMYHFLVVASVRDWIQEMDRSTYMRGIPPVWDLYFARLVVADITANDNDIYDVEYIIPEEPDYDIYFESPPIHYRPSYGAEVETRMKRARSPTPQQHIASAKDLQVPCSVRG